MPVSGVLFGTGASRAMFMALGTASRVPGRLVSMASAVPSMPLTMGVSSATPSPRGGRLRSAISSSTSSTSEGPSVSSSPRRGRPASASSSPTPLSNGLSSSARRFPKLVKCRLIPAHVSHSIGRVRRSGSNVSISGDGDFCSTMQWMEATYLEEASGRRPASQLPHSPPHPPRRRDREHVVGVLAPLEHVVLQPAVGMHGVSSSPRDPCWWDRPGRGRRHRDQCWESMAGVR